MSSTFIDYVRSGKPIQVYTQNKVYDATFVCSDTDSITVRVVDTEMCFYWNTDMNLFWLSAETYLIFPELVSPFPPVTIYVISDLHTEFGLTKENNPETWPNADILVLAGDIGNPFEESYKKILKDSKKKYKDVIYISGNHEFYGCNYNREKVITKLKELADETKTHFLHRGSKVIQNIQFIGTTLWSLIDSEESCKELRDFSKGVFMERIDYIEEFILNYSYLRDTLKYKYCYPQVVITHHLPTKKLIHSRFWNHSHSSCFYTDLLGKLCTTNVKYWFCGHTHEYKKTQYGKTTLVVNPVGYPKETRLTAISNEVFSIN